MEGGPCWVISLVGSGITSVASVGRLWGSRVSVKRALVVGEWVSPPSNSLLGGSNPICGALSDGKTSVMMHVHVERVHTDLFTRVAVSR